jgi:peptidoglycan/LPS O-acetylase OafA/YrhL
MTTLLAPGAQADSRRAAGVRKFRPDIEGLRAVAVVAVVLAHAGLALPGGYIGVDVFFVISGFLITRQLVTELDSRNRISFRKFYARRARRILPAATLVIVVTLLATWKWYPPLQVQSASEDGLASALSVVNWRFAIEGTDYFQATDPASPFQHYWSLAVEEQFYLLWPALLVGVAVLIGRRFGRRSTLVWSTLLIMAVSLALSVTTTESSPSWAYFGSQTRAWELAFGALLAITVTVWTRMPPALASQMSWVGLGMIVLSALTYSDTTVYPGIAVSLPVVGSAFVIAGGCPGWPRGAEFVLKRRPMQFMGMTSYSWYLWHWPILIILPLALGRELSTFELWGVVFGSLALAALTYYALERPVRTRQSLVRAPWRGLLLGAGLVAVSVCVAVAVAAAVVVPGGSGVAAPVAAAPVTLTALQSAIAEGVELKSLPSNVTPALADAATDHPNTHGCMVGFDALAPPPDADCTFGDLTATRTFVVVGDSHANAWFPAMLAFATEHHWRFVLYAKGACPPGVYPGYMNNLTNRVYTECDTWRSAMFDRVNALKPDVVIVTSQTRVVAVEPSGMAKTVTNLSASGARVIYLEDTPYPGTTVGAVPDCLAAHPDDIQQCSLVRADPQNRLETMLQRTTEINAARDAGATLWDPTEWFCTATTCPAVIGNIVVYSDTSHTTATYISWLAPEFSAALGKIVD